MTFVLDNSVTMRWFFGDGQPKEIAYAGKVLDRLKSATAIVPAIWGLEVANVLTRAEAKGLVSEARSEAFLGLLTDLGIEVDDATATHAMADTLQLARRYKLSAYDAAYLELALRQGAPLATLDENLLRAAQKAGVKRLG